MLSLTPVVELIKSFKGGQSTIQLRQQQPKSDESASCKVTQKPTHLHTHG